MESTPQLENGYVRIASELLEALARFDLTGAEWRVIFSIMRKTYGFNKKEDFISYGKIADMTRMKRQNVMRVVKNLVLKKVLSVIKSDDRKVNLIKINKKYSDWVNVTSYGLGRVITVETFNGGVITVDDRVSSQLRPPVITVDDTSVITVETHNIQKTINNRHLLKERVASLSNLTDEDFQEIADKYKTSLAFVRSKYDDLVNYCGAHNKTYANYKLALMKWVKKDIVTNFQKRNERIAFIDPA